VRKSQEALTSVVEGLWSNMPTGRDDADPMVTIDRR
jgi:hypothetical protein